jgi:hypothetical protein
MVFAATPGAETDLFGVCASTLNDRSKREVWEFKYEEIAR